MIRHHQETGVVVEPREHAGERLVEELVEAQHDVGELRRTGMRGMRGIHEMPEEVLQLVQRVEHHPQEIPPLVLEEVEHLCSLDPLQLEGVLGEGAQIADLQRVGVDVEPIAVDVRLELVAQLRRERIVLHALRRHDARDDEAVEVLGRIRQREMHDAGALPVHVGDVPDTAAAQVRGRQRQLAGAATADLVEVVDVVLAGILAGRRRCPRRRRQRRQRAAQLGVRALREQAGERRQLALCRPRLDEVEGRAVETDDDHAGDGRHQRHTSGRVTSPRSPRATADTTGRGVAPATAS